MTSPPTLRFASIGVPAGGHSAARRHAGSSPPAALDLAATYVRRAADAGIAAVLLATDPTARDEPPAAPAASASARTFESLTLLSALAVLTDRIGLVATTTGFDEPYHVARRLASLDHISAGRAGWCLDTRDVSRRAGGFLGERGDAPASRVERAEEFARVVRGLWDSYDEDAIVADKRSGRYFRPGGRRPLDHVGRHFRVAGPLNVARPPQGHPVVFLAAADPAELDLAARQADVVLVDAHSIDDARARRVALDRAAAAAGRPPGSVQLWPCISPVIGADGRVADVPVGGTPEQVADRLADWFRSGAADGFAVGFPELPVDAERFFDEVLPILARQGVFVPSKGTTLRDVLGLARPERSVA